MCSHVKPQNFSVRHCSSSWLILTSFLCIRIILLTPSTTFMRIHKNKTVPIITSHNTRTYKLTHFWDSHKNTNDQMSLFLFLSNARTKIKIHLFYIYTRRWATTRIRRTKPWREERRKMKNITPTFDTSWYLASVTKRP